MRRPSALALALAVALSPITAHAHPGLMLWQPDTSAEDTQDRARSLFAAGSNAYTLGHYEEAIAKFEEAYALLQEPVFLFNLAQSYWKRNELDPNPKYLRRARLLFKNYLKSADLTAQEAQEVQANIETIEGQIKEAEGKSTVAPQPGPEAKPDPEPDPEPGPAQESEPQPAEPSPAGEPDRPYKLGTLGKIGIGLIAAGVVGGAAGVTTGQVSANKLRSQQDAELMDPRYTDERGELYDTAVGRAQGLSLITAIGGAALVVTGTVLAIVDRARHKKKSTATATKPSAHVKASPTGLIVRF